MENATVQYNIGSGTGESLKAFQLDPKANKSTPEFGFAISKYIATTVFGGPTQSYYYDRNARFFMNRQMASGKMNVARFMDQLQMNGKNNYGNINWSAIKVVNTIISKTVGRWMERREKISVTATDPLSVEDKMEDYKQALFTLTQRKVLESLQQKSGMQMIPQNQFVAGSMEDLLLWRAEYQRLPEEILYEIGSNNILEDAGFGSTGTNKDKLCQDSAEVGLVAMYVHMDDMGIIHPEWVKPENAFYSYSEYNDLRDTTWRGRVINMKISQLRRKYGVEFGGKVTEQQLWEFAQKSKSYVPNDNLVWNPSWNGSYLRPYDEWNLDVMEFEIKTIDSEPYSVIKTKGNNSTIIKKGYDTSTSNDVELVDDSYENIYRGVFIRELEFVLEWGVKKNMIRPNDPHHSGNAYFSYVFYMYKNRDMKNVAIPEKVQRPAEQMLIACYKIEQVVSKMRPPGAAINESALQKVVYGLGDSDKDVDYKKHYDQTGTIYYRGTDDDGNPVPVPITELTNAGFQPALMALIEDYRFHYQVLKDELGEDPSLVTQAAQPRVSTDNIQTSLQQSEYATDYMYDAVKKVIEQAAKLIGCLLYNSVEFGAAAYREIMNEEMIKGRVFSMKIKDLPDDIEIAKLEGFLNEAIRSNPQLVQFLDTFLAMRMAKENVKLAELYVRNCQKKMLAYLDQQAQQNQQMTIQGQQQTAQQGIDGQKEIEQMKSRFETQKTTEISRADKEKILLTGFTQMWAAGVPVPPELKQLEAEIIKNIGLPLFAENQVQAAQVQQAQMLEQQAGQNAQQPSQNNIPPQPQPQQQAA